MFTVLANIVLCPFSHILVTNSTSLYVLVQDVSNLIVDVDRAACNSPSIDLALAFTGGGCFDYMG